MLPDHHSGMDPESTTEIVRVKTASSDDETCLISTCLSFCSIPPWTRPWIRPLGLFVASLNTGGVITIPPHYHHCSRVQSPKSLLQQALFFVFFSVFTHNYNFLQIIVTFSTQPEVFGGLLEHRSVEF